MPGRTSAPWNMSKWSLHQSAQPEEKNSLSASLHPPALIAQRKFESQFLKPDNELNPVPQPASRTAQDQSKIIIDKM